MSLFDGINSGLTEIDNAAGSAFGGFLEQFATHKVISPTELGKIETGVQTAMKVNWSALHDAFAKKDYMIVGDLAVEDALTIAQPWLPEAGTAKFVLHIAYSIAHQHASDGPGAKFTMQDLLKGLIAAEGVDWKGFYHALKGGNALIVAADTGEILTKLAVPFFPPATPLTYVFAAFAFVAEFTTPAMPYSIPGYRYDMLNGWVPDHK